MVWMSQSISCCDSVVADHGPPFMATCHHLLIATASGKMPPVMSQKSQTGFMNISWTWVTSPFTRCESSRLTLGCGRTGGRRHGLAAAKSAKKYAMPSRQHGAESHRKIEKLMTWRTEAVLRPKGRATQCQYGVPNKMTPSVQYTIYVTFKLHSFFIFNSNELCGSLHVCVRTCMCVLVCMHTVYICMFSMCYSVAQ